MTFAPDDLVLEIDAEKTKRFYSRAQALTRSCGCPGCRNFAEAAAGFPAAVLDFLETLGIDAAKPAEVYAYGAAAGGRAVYYGGFYHLCAAVHTGNTRADTFHTIAPGFRVYFTEALSLPEADLPAPALQMEIDFSAVPWVLNEENPY